MKDAIFNFIVDKGDNVSFAEFEKSLDGFKGNFEFGRPEKNIVFWQGASPEFVNGLNALIEEGLVDIKGVSEIIYLVDGCMPRLPLAKQNRKYKDTHWVPAVVQLTKKGLVRGEKEISEGKHPYKNPTA